MMPHQATSRILLILLIGYLLLALPAYLGPDWIEPFSAVLVLVPYLSVHLFNHMGVPGLLEHGGFCGWGWCAPTVFGWAFMVALWLGVFWAAAWGIAWLLARRR
jgi:hypothetical protein